MAHAILSPSAASRWMACTPSARLEQEQPNKSSSYADEGTLAHAIGECILRDPIGYDKSPQFLKLIESEYYSPAMLEYCENYAQLVLSFHTPGITHLFIEEKLDMTNYIEGGFGTADAIILQDGLLRFFDLKYGRGVKVFAENNKQLMIYALGVLNDYGHLFNVTEVEVNIYQPRLDHHDPWTISVIELLHWAETELKEKAKMAFAGEGDFVPGSHCGFCRVKGQCKALAAYNLALIKEDFRDPALLTDDEVLDIFNKKALFSSWIDSVGDYLFNSALDGKKWPGLKVVEGKSNRIYSSEQAVIDALKAKNITDIYAPAKILGLGAMEKKIGKETFSYTVAPLLVKPAGKPTLVADTDPRTEIGKAETDFKPEA